ncbi:uncharacterized protein ACLA_091980 [Aspergillus clavatus NRRL 1]|uniref:Serine/threonine-protein kinase ppk6 n=1 Tax=Aspergillus clavatus (strain ATCC 1007 / CBS 513.65 / DSM 816 / NCTC 3887 / NRRL 1 / QM 1276 / 107) TaxID=344612 RepID=A1CF51_ASPCL|nr:uncharacterized protein ACLA_091980 [Aspergillus clavatus NRRL 1]EAW11500.1 conserved hypothetical protein [Aspergillus clavatus NRRL 1]
MSADLFAEFGHQGSPSNPPAGSHQQHPRFQTNSLIPDLDGFEEATSASSPQNDLNNQQFLSHNSQSWTSPGHSAFALSNTSSQFQGYEEDSNVLFDATLESVSDNESEDWGDFETAETMTGQRQSQAYAERSTKPQGAQRSPGLATPINLMDTLSIEDAKPPIPGRSTVTRRTNEPVSKTRISSPTPLSSTPAHEESFEEWGEFIDGPVEEPISAGVSNASANKAAPDRTTNPTESVRVPLPSPTAQKERASEAQIRPTNIPPPSVLLELFPRLFEQLRQEATTARRNPQQKDTVENVASLVFCTLKAAARVVAGRTLRWKRDSILSQSMRIGPARAGKTGGMKLSTVNRNESIKEQQETIDVLNTWRDHTALFSSVIQASGRRPIQVISENARVTTATSAQGAIKAAHACALCGLKREERLHKVDENVEDSFGEWWVEHWGHTECKEFWERNMKLLAQR